MTYEKLVNFKAFYYSGKMGCKQIGPQTVGPWTFTPRTVGPWGQTVWARLSEARFAKSPFNYHRFLANLALDSWAQNREQVK